MATWKRWWSTVLLDLRPSLAETWAGMSRHQMTESMAMGQAAPAADWMEGAQLAVAGRAAFEGETEPIGGGRGAGRQVASSVWAR